MLCIIFTYCMYTELFSLNLYGLFKLTSLQKVNKNTVSNISIIVKNKEKCPLKDPVLVTKECSYYGQKIEIPDHNVTVTVLQGAIEKGYTVEIEVAASLFGLYEFPKDCFRISPYVWIGTSYSFKKPLEIEVEHHAVVAKEDDVSKICVLEACEDKENDHSNEHKLFESSEKYKSRCGIGSSFYTYYTYSKHTCVAKKSESIPVEVAVYQYLPYNYAEIDCFDVEVCFCCNLKFFKKVSI